MKIYRYPTPQNWKEITERPHLDVSLLNNTVSMVLNDIRKRGDQAVKDYEERGSSITEQELNLSQAEAERLMSHAICARLAEACAEWLQNHSPLTSHHSPLRVAFGYATCPDHSLKRIVFDLLDAERLLNVTLTDHYSIQPSTAICGLFICHPEARYFSVGRIDEEQLTDYCQRRGISVAEGEQLLSKYIVRYNGITS